MRPDPYGKAHVHGAVPRRARRLHTSICNAPFRGHDLDNRGAAGQEAFAKPQAFPYRRKRNWETGLGLGRHREGGSVSETQWMSLVALLMVAVLVVPAALRRNRGVVLRNAALWLALIVALVWVYNRFGPFGL